MENKINELEKQVSFLLKAVGSEQIRISDLYQNIVDEFRRINERLDKFKNI